MGGSAGGAAEAWACQPGRLNVALDYDLTEYRAVMDLHNTACEAWEVNADPARCTQTTVRVKNATHAAFSAKVAALLRELQELRGQRGAMAALMRELLRVVQTLDEPENDDEAQLLHDLESKATAMLAHIDQQAARSMVPA
jgi:hypothetical protein